MIMATLAKYLTQLAKKRDLATDATTLGTTPERLQEALEGKVMLDPQQAVALARCYGGDARKIMDLQYNDQLKGLKAEEKANPAPKSEVKNDGRSSRSCAPLPSRGVVTIHPSTETISLVASSFSRRR